MLCAKGAPSTTRLPALRSRAMTELALGAAPLLQIQIPAPWVDIAISLKNAAGATWWRRWRWSRRRGRSWCRRPRPLRVVDRRHDAGERFTSSGEDVACRRGEATAARARGTQLKADSKRAKLVGIVD